MSQLTKQKLRIGIRITGPYRRSKSKSSKQWHKWSANANWYHRNHGTVFNLRSIALKSGNKYPHDFGHIVIDTIQGAASQHIDFDEEDVLYADRGYGDLLDVLDELFRCHYGRC